MIAPYDKRFTPVNNILHRTTVGISTMISTGYIHYRHVTITFFEILKTVEPCSFRNTVLYITIMF